jgi:hypothetical protein
MLKHDLIEEFKDVLYGIQNGFTLKSTKTISRTVVSKNYSSTRKNRDAVNESIKKELDEGRYHGPYTQSQLEAKLGRPFISHPLGMRLKSDGKRWRIVEDLSWTPSPNISSVNQCSDHSDVPAECDGIAEMKERVITAKPGTQGATLDWGEAFRQIPIKKEELWMGIVQWNVIEGGPKQFYIDGNAKFGHKRSTGTFGRVNKAFATLIKKEGTTDVLYWVDDLCAIREPVNNHEPWRYKSDTDDIRSLANYLGVPLPEDKIRDYSNVTRYVGFDWHWDSKKVTIPEDKKDKVRNKIEDFTNDWLISKADLRSLCGSLAHLAQVVLEGRARMRGLYKMVSDIMGMETFPLSPEALEELEWWEAQLQSGRELGMPLCTEPSPSNFLKVYVDACSTGIGIVINGEYDSFFLSSNWEDAGDGTRREIGWAELVAVEVAVFILISKYKHEIRRRHVLIHSENRGLTNIWKARWSRDAQYNAVILRILQMLGEVEAFISIDYVLPVENPADAASHGNSPAGLTRLSFSTIPRPLKSIVFRREMNGLARRWHL